MIYQANQKDYHLNAIKCLIIYVNVTTNYGIWYLKDSNVNLVGYTNSNAIGDSNDRKRISGFCFYIKTNLVD